MDEAKGDDIFKKQRLNMVEHQIHRRGVSDIRVLDAMRKVKRHEFVPGISQIFAYDDRPQSIGHGQTISQPYIVGYMTEAARLKNSDKVLESGTGSGYQAAILAEIAKEVYSIEIIPELAEKAEKRLQVMGYKNIFVKCGDGYQGWPEHAPFNAIIVTAAPEEIPERLVEQLAVGGRMVIPVGSAEQELYIITKTNQGIEQRSVFPVRFVPMVKDE